jgi:hypothetical protein
MSSLLIYISLQERFELGRLRAFLEQCPGVSNIRESEVPSAVLTANFTDRPDATIVDVDAKLQTVNTSGSRVVNVQFAFLLQQSWPMPLHVIDEGYSFDLVIRYYESAWELQEAMIAATKRAIEEAD